MVQLSLPAWVEHPIIDDKKRKRQTIFSIHVHPDGSRLATGGLDQKVRVWATEPIVNEEVEHRKDAHKLLCAMTRHTGSVLVVRWSSSGRYLASGSDDTICLIWELDPTGLGGGSFGSFGSREEETNVETWRTHRRLAFHETDVVDLAWSTDEDDSYLATVSLDAHVVVWSGPRNGAGSFERLRVLDGHQGFVKGVVWDPIGQFLATFSDDKSVRIWRVGGDWRLEKLITKPFEGSRSTFFRRSSWSPDGENLLCANAMAGSIFVANVINRKDWSSEINLVGHENAIAVTSFCPRLVHSGQDDGKEQPACTTMLALGSLDQSISIWIADHSRPLAVARDVFQLQIMDLSWSKDGRTLYACSADGYIAAFTFTKEDHVSFASEQELKEAREEYNFEEHQRNFRRSKADSLHANGGLGAGSHHGTTDRPNMLVARKAGVPRAPIASSVVAPTSTQTKRLDQVITLTRDGKRRIKPTLLNGSGETATDPLYVSSSSYESNGPVSPSPSQQRGIKRTASMANDEEFGEHHEESLPTPAGKKIKDGSRTLGGEIRRGQAGPAVVLQKDEGNLRVSRTDIVSRGMAALPLPATMSKFKREDANGVSIEVRNFAEDNLPTEIYYFETQNASRCTWMDFSPQRVILATLSDVFTAFACEDGSLITYSPKGRRLSSLQLDAACHKLECCGEFLVAILVDGQVRRWNARQGVEVGQSMSVQSLFTAKNIGALVQDEILHFWVHNNGLPVIITRSERAFTQDVQKNAWTLISSGWFADCSPKWEGRSRGRGASMDSVNSAGLSAIRRDPIRTIESTINDLVIIHRSSTGIKPAGKPSSTAQLDEFEIAVTLRHLEARMSASALLDSGQEYRTHLLTYAKTLGETGIRNQAEELCRSLMGPVYHTVSSSPNEAFASLWSPTVCGMQKRELLVEVLRAMARGRLLLGLVETYQKLLKDVQQQPHELY